MVERYEDDLIIVLGGKGIDDIGKAGGNKNLNLGGQIQAIFADAGAGDAIIEQLKAHFITSYSEYYTLTHHGEKNTPLEYLATRTWELVVAAAQNGVDLQAIGERGTKPEPMAIVPGPGLPLRSEPVSAKEMLAAKHALTVDEWLYKALLSRRYDEVSVQAPKLPSAVTDSYFDPIKRLFIKGLPDSAHNNNKYWQQAFSRVQKRVEANLTGIENGKFGDFTVEERRGFMNQYSRAPRSHETFTREQLRTSAKLIYAQSVPPKRYDKVGQALLVEHTVTARQLLHDALYDQAVNKKEGSDTSPFFDEVIYDVFRGDTTLRPSPLYRRFKVAHVIL